MNRPYDIIALGELNVDLLFNRLEGTPELGKEIFSRDMTLTLGSSTAIFAANAASLGSRVAFFGKIGHDGFGEVVLSTLKERGVDTSMILEGSTPTGLSSIYNYGTERYCVTFPGAMKELGVKEIDPEQIRKGRHVHISSIFLQEQLHADLAEIVKLVKSCGCTISMDVQWDPTEKWEFDYRNILPYVDVFLPNETEIRCITGADTVEEALEALKGYLRAAVIKMGTKGSLLVRPDGTCRQVSALLSPRFVDAVGAGDSFDAGFVHSFVQGRSLEDSQDFGNLTGALNTTAAGGTGAFASKENARKTAMELFGLDLI